ncbi:peptide/nickel transport system permease protein [Caldalkalibacillus uzonensis]|uniref:Peptide/nickel transport system permease protein n=1 Tax=Caldalkalibacillus uzonensis TaxID=353224 RepID=A0ABU0CXV5_9BACI|nr:ABC transporter permease [Caldalkalibacillus uzonensis]MDQ0340985.1 peptide/nickel transport system permease protein [Caldalkalibacillus uzonensis]
MRAYILTRLLSLIPVLIIVAVIVFFLIHLTPGDPAAIMLGPQATPEEVERLREQLGLNLPLHEQFFNWFFGLFRGDLGWSISHNKPVLTAFIEHLGPTISLSILAQAISMILAIPLGIIAAKRRGTRVDQTFMVLVMLGMAIPSFLMGLLLMQLFGVKLQWFPVAGYEPLSAGLWDHLKFMILPATALGIIQTAVIARMTRSSMLDVFSANYIKTAYAKGVKESIVVYKHALRNAAIPILTVLGEAFGTLIAGAVVTETVFNLPGIGQLVINAIEKRDYAVIQGTILLAAASYLLVNLIVDLLYGVVDPRVRLSRKS